jgi:hypothetical protein
MRSQPSLREPMQNGTMIAALWLRKMFGSDVSIGIWSQLRKRKNYGGPSKRNTYSGGMKESFSCKEQVVVVKKKVVLQPEGTWDYEDGNFTTYTHGKPLLPKCKITERVFLVKSFQGWYLKACALGIEFIQA